MNKTPVLTSKKSCDAELFDNNITKEFITLGELAARLKLSVSGLRKIIARDKDFPRYKVGRQLRFCWNAMESYFQRRG